MPYKNLIKICEQCHQEFGAKKKKQRMCSPECAGLYKRRPEGLLRRFWAKVNKFGPTQPHCPELGPCWEWTGSRSGGYGHLIVREPKLCLSHRVSWTIHVGPIAENMDVLHKCDNRSCIRPSHLFLGTDSDNQRDAIKKGRFPCRHGEVNGMTKISEQTAIRIKAELLIRGPKAVSVLLGVSRRTVEHISAGDTWKHLP